MLKRNDDGKFVDSSSECCIDEREHDILSARAVHGVLKRILLNQPLNRLTRREILKCLSYDINACAVCYRPSVSRSYKAREELFELQMQIAR